ncbi:helicase-related protein, partial [Ideonella dechloratans]
RQTLMASATFDGEVGRLAQRLQKDDVERIEIAGHTAKHENITQQLMWADSLDHKKALLDSLLTDRHVDQAVVFTSTQVDADFLADRLADMGHRVAALHGGMPQGRRNRVLQGLRSRQLRILVATDVAARGIDVPTITHVINYGLPLKAEDYVHRIGRTGRAGREGRAVTLAERRDVPMIRRIQHYTTQPIPVATVEGLEPSKPAPEIFNPRPPRGGAPRGRGGFGGGFGGQQDRQGYGARPPRDRRPNDRPAFGRQESPFERREGGHFERRDGGQFEPRREGGHFERRDGGHFEQRREGGHFERREGGHFERRDSAPFERRAPRADRPAFAGRDGGERPQRAPFEARREGGWEGSRGPRQGAGKPASAGNKPRFANSGSNAGKRPRKDV